MMALLFGTNCLQAVTKQDPWEVGTHALLAYSVLLHARLALYPASHLPLCDLFRYEVCHIYLMSERECPKPSVRSTSPM